jgi:hypothetical protein
MTTPEEFERRLRQAEEKADKAAEVAMMAITVQRNLHSALEKSHEQMGEMLAASRAMARLTEALAQHVLGGLPSLPRTSTPRPVVTP